MQIVSKPIKKVMFSLPVNLTQDLNLFSKEFNLTKSALVSQALENYFDMLDLKLAEKRIKENNQRVSLEDFISGLED